MEKSRQPPRSYICRSQLRFGASLTVASYVIPSFLAEFSRAYPRVEIELRVDNTEVVLESVREGFYPFGLVEGSPRAAGLRLEQFVEDEVVLVAGANHCMGLAFLSRWSVKNELAVGQLRLVRISDLAVRRGFYWVLPSGALGEPSDTFVRFCNGYRSQLSSPRA